VHQQTDEPCSPEHYVQLFCCDGGGEGGDSYTLVDTLLVSQVSDNIVEKHSQPMTCLFLLVSQPGRLEVGGRSTAVKMSVNSS
jgi:hypothetical protein